MSSSIINLENLNGSWHVEVEAMDASGNSKRETFNSPTLDEAMKQALGVFSRITAKPKEKVKPVEEVKPVKAPPPPPPHRVQLKKKGK